MEDRGGLCICSHGQTAMNRQPLKQTISIMPRLPSFCAHCSRDTEKHMAAAFTGVCCVMSGIFSVALQGRDHISPDVGEYILPMERKHLNLSSSWEELPGCPCHPRDSKKTLSHYPHISSCSQLQLRWQKHF